MSLTDLTLFEATKAVVKGEVTSLDLVESMLNRIDAVDPKLNAFIRVEADTARSEAAEIDKARAAGKTLVRLLVCHWHTKICITVQVALLRVGVKFERILDQR